MSDTIDYETVEVPDDKPPAEYTYGERRASVLREIRDAGHPRLVNGSELARKFGVTRQTIYNDFDVLGEAVEASLGERHVLATDATFQKCTAELLSEGEWRAASRTAQERSEWIRERVELRQLREEVAEVVAAQERGKYR